MARKRKTMDGSQMAAYASHALTDVAAIYPITPFLPMAEHTDEWATQGLKNIFGHTVQIMEMQSEAGATGTVYDSLVAGALTMTYTASQGLPPMIPNLYKIAGGTLPGVLNVLVRAIATHALSILDDHSDIYTCRQTGCVMLCESSVQEVTDLMPVAHLVTIKGRIPLINSLDGFRTPHKTQKIQIWDYEDLKDMADFDATQAFRDKALNLDHAEEKGQAQNPDVFFQISESRDQFYDKLPEIVQDYMDKVDVEFGADCKLFNYYGAEDTEVAIITMGSVNDMIKETVDCLTKQGKKVGLVRVRLYRPFSAKILVEALPKSMKHIEVFGRTEEAGSIDEPLYLDMIAALRDTEFVNVPVFMGRYGLSSKDTTPKDIVAVFESAEKKRFTVGTVDDVAHPSLKAGANLVTTLEDVMNYKLWGFGTGGIVDANKNPIKIIGDNTDTYVQVYFDYDPKKSGGVTMSHLRFGHKPIKSTYLIHQADFMVRHNPACIRKYNMVQELADGGTFLLNYAWSGAELEEHSPGQVKKYIYDHKINLYTTDGVKIGIETGTGPTRINTVLQFIFFKLTGIIPEERAITLMKDVAQKTYGHEGEDVVKKNWNVTDAGASDAHKVGVPESWKDVKDKGLDFTHASYGPEAVKKFVNMIQSAVDAQGDNNLSASVFADYTDDIMSNSTVVYEKCGIAVGVPVWSPNICVQCTQCSYVCPHAAIRPVAMIEGEVKNAPEGMKMTDLKVMPGYRFAINVSVLDCTGCGSCANVCPGNVKNRTPVMQPFADNADKQKFFDCAVTLPERQEVIDKFKMSTVKGSQFKKPLLESSGACAGCGETPYIKLITQLFGDRMYILNATGCSSIWGNSSPSTPYTVNGKGQGSARGNSLFEDNVEFGYGMLLANHVVCDGPKSKVEELNETASNDETKKACQAWLDTYPVDAANGAATDALVEVLEKDGSELAKEILKQKDYLSKKSQWIFGGGGWVYDIGFGGVDHVIASDKDINTLVFDTEVYSSTSGQSFKPTKIGAIAQFAAGGKETRKKDLVGVAMTYDYVYVVQISMGTDMSQVLKALAETETYPGPFLILAYSPCINHGIKKGMSKAMTEEKLAVESGYWNDFRFNLAVEGKSTLDLKAPKEGERGDFLMGEVRYNSLIPKSPERAEQFLMKSEQDATARYEYLKKLVALYDDSKTE